MQGKTVTLSDIARATGFSINTVSHALNDKPDISEKTKKLIRKVSNDMGYISNTSAVFLRSGKSKSIALIFPDIANPHFSVVIKEIEIHLKSYEYTTIILNTDEDETIEKEAIISAKSKNVDGIIICPTQKSYSNIALLKKLNIPFIFLGRYFPNHNSNYVICDDVSGGYIAAKYFLSRNHKNILFFNAPLYISSASDRLEGIKKAFSEFKTDFNKDAVCLLPHNFSGNTSKIKKFLTVNEGYTAIICFSDLIAMEVICTLQELNRNVPDDISVIGFDDIMSRFRFPLKLTSVSSRESTMAKESVDGIMNIIEHKGKSFIKEKLEVKIVERDTVKVLD